MSHTQVELKNLLETIKLKNLKRYKTWLIGKYDRPRKECSIREFVWTFCKYPVYANELEILLTNSLECMYEKKRGIAQTRGLKEIRKNCLIKQMAEKEIGNSLPEKKIYDFVEEDTKRKKESLVTLQQLADYVSEETESESLTDEESTDEETESESLTDNRRRVPSSKEIFENGRLLWCSGNESKYNEGMVKILIAADNGYEPAQDKLRIIYSMDKDASQDFSDKGLIRFYISKANSKDKTNAWACNYLGYMYDIGLGVMRNTRKAIFYYRKAAKAGHKIALDNLFKFKT